MNTPAYTLEWVRFQGRFSGRNGIIGGYLATPIGGPNQKPTVLSMMGYEDMNASFGITNFPYPYLNAYGDYLARQGYIVFMPYIMYPFYYGWGADTTASVHKSSKEYLAVPFTLLYEQCRFPDGTAQC